jgi:serine/threonine-protein kinase
VLVPGAVDAHLLPTGQLTYTKGNSVWAVPFDSGQRKVLTGRQVPLVEDVSTGDGSSQFAVSRDGTLAYVPASGPAPSRPLVWVDRHGNEQPISAPPLRYGRPRLSPDETHLAVNASPVNGGGDIWMGTFAREFRDLRIVAFSRSPADESNPLWMLPGGDRVAFDSRADGLIRIVSKAANGTGPLQPESPPPGGYPETMSPDGKSFIYHTAGNVSMLVPRNPPSEARPLVPTNPTVQLLNAEISPDGNWIAYQSNETGRFEIYVDRFPDMNGRWTIPSSTGGSAPAWARRGKDLELFFISGLPDSMMMSVSVPVQAGPGSTFGNPELLFPAGRYFSFVAREYDVSHDGKRFLMIKPFDPVTGARPSLIVVSHWFDEVRAKMRGQ